MDPVVRLVTSVDLDPDADADADRTLSVRARHEAELAGGRRVLLLDDRGWTASGPPGVWARTTVEEIGRTARTVVGPDEPFAGRSAADMAADHWADLARRLHRSGVAADASQLRRLPHDVVLGDRLLRRLRPGPGGAAPR